MSIFGFYRCELCGKELFEDKYFCGGCMKELEDYLVLERFEDQGYYVYSLFFYRGKIRDLIRKWKFYSSPYMIGPMAHLLKRFILENDIYLEAISYIPMHRRKRLVRGFDPLEDLARELADLLNLPCLSLLERIRPTRPLYKLSAPDRKRELKGCFQVKRAYQGQVVAILDDIYTTGATTREAASSLFEAGHENFFYIILAK